MTILCGGGHSATMSADLDREFGDRVYAIGDDVVWVSGINEYCVLVAEKMARTPAHSNDIPTSLVYDDGAARSRLTAVNR